MTSFWSKVQGLTSILVHVWYQCMSSFCRDSSLCIGSSLILICGFVMPNWSMYMILLQSLLYRAQCICDLTPVLVFTFIKVLWFHFCHGIILINLTFTFVLAPFWYIYIYDFVMTSFWYTQFFLLSWHQFDQYTCSYCYDTRLIIYVFLAPVMASLRSYTCSSFICWYHFDHMHDLWCCDSNLIKYHV